MSGPTVALLVVIGAIAAIVLIAATSRMAVRSATEFRARVLETIGAAMRRGLPVGPELLWQVAHDCRGARRRRVLRAATELDGGASMAAALGTGLALPPQDVALLRAAEGGAAFEAALRRVAQGARDGARNVHRVMLLLAVPALAAGLVALAPADGIEQVCSSMDIDTPWLHASLLTLRWIAVAFVASFALLVIGRMRWALWVRDRVQRLRPGCSRGEVAGFASALASAVRSGRPLDEALERASAAFAGRRAVLRVRAVAVRVTEGESAREAWRAMPLPRWALARGAVLEGPPAAVATALDDLSRRADERADAAREAWLRWAGPLFVLVAAGAIGNVLLMLLLTTQRLAIGVQPW